MIIIHPLKIAFANAPKVGSTSLLNWLYSLLFDGAEYKPVKTSNQHTLYIHGWMNAQQSDIIENQPLESFKCPEGYLVFCLVRDPVKKLLSAYSNRVLYHNELNFSHKQGQKEAINSGLLAARPTLNYFIEHLEEYQAIAPSILHHTTPLIYFLGTDSTIYDYIFDISEMKSLRQMLLNHWHTHNILENKTIIEIPHLQVEGQKFRLNDLTESNFKKCLELYNDDYAAYSVLNKSETIHAWEQAYKEHDKPKVNHISKAIIKIKPCKEIIAFHWLSKNELNISENELESFTGAIVLKATIQDNYRLIVSDARGEWQIKWQPSPKIAAQYPDNPHALNARFTADNLQTSSGHPVRVFLENTSGKRHLLFTIEKSHQYLLA